MAKHLLSARRVQTSGKGVYGDGAGLRLRVKATGASWLLRYTAPSGKLRELGLGAADRASTAAAGKSLREARDAADAARRLIRSGVDPIDEKRAKAREVEAKTQAEARRERTTLGRVARAYHERVIELRRTDVHAREWISSLERHVPKEIWHKPIDRVARRRASRAALEDAAAGAWVGVPSRSHRGLPCAEARAISRRCVRASEQPALWLVSSEVLRYSVDVIHDDRHILRIMTCIM